MNMWNILIRRTFICIGIPKHWQLTLVQVWNVYWLLEFSFSTRGERDTIFTMLTVSSDPTNTREPHSTQLDSPRPASNLNWSRPASDLNSLLFLKITKIVSPSLPGMMSFAPQSLFLSGVFIMTFVIVTREREHLHSMCALAHALSWIVLSLT